MSSFDFGSTLGGAHAGAEAGFQVGGPWGAAIGGVIGGVTGGVFGSKAKKKRKTAERLLREVNAIKRMQNRRAAIVEAVQAQAVASVSGYGDGYNPEGTSSAVGVQQSIYAQVQSNLKTESTIYGRQEKAAQLMKQSGRAINTLGTLASLAKTGGDLYSRMPKSSGGTNDYSQLSSYTDLPMH